MEQSACSS